MRTSTICSIIIISIRYFDNNFIDYYYILFELNYLYINIDITNIDIEYVY